LLSKVHKNLEDYLETKRMAFPRFYFLSNDELLEILSQTKNVQAVQPHMAKCFDGIRKLDFGEEPKSIDIFAMISGEGEKVSLGKNLKARGTVEVWLTLVEQHMLAQLRKLGKEAYRSYHDIVRTVWVLDNPAQLVVTVSQIHWVAKLEKCLKHKAPAEALRDFLNDNVLQLEELTSLVRSDLSPLQRKVVVPLMTVDVHARDIVDNMMVDGVTAVSDFGWQMQLRFYWDVINDEVTIAQTNATFKYGYEYLGAQPRLVVTPMTDRCFMTLSGALHLKFGGAPAGPAGTGKTETTKDLGKALGVQCVVFNCGDNLDYKFMGKFFAGLAQCGAWACFDEFNRIDIEVLSVVAQQLLTIQNALKAEAVKFLFEGREIRLVASCGVFITMNPGYAGRTELPDNLTALFRPMSMMVPDYALVAEVMLFAEGFDDAKTLSRKMVKLYKLSSEQLSQQDHYDFGMRALKSVLVMAGALKRSSPNLNESVVLIRAMRDSNLPKFLSEDAKLFQALINDLFLGVAIPETDYGELQQVLFKVLDDIGLVAIMAFMTKVLQLFETFSVRFGVMLVGPTGGGKTQIYNALQGACGRLRAEDCADESYQEVHTYVLNPKCIKMGELYGEYNLLTNEWTDGLASTLIRQAVADEGPDQHWVVFDGPVDAIWIENMNTVLDDNCTLCLPNGERIKLNPVTMRMLFEVQDLAVASPATVSRCGMVYVPPEDMGWRPYTTTWLNKVVRQMGMAQEHRDFIWELFDTFMDTMLTFVRLECKETIPSVNINLVTSCTMLMQSLMDPKKGLDLNMNSETWEPYLNHLFAFSMTWSLGGNIDESSTDRFDEFIRLTLSACIVFPSSSGTIFEYYVDEFGTFRPWEEIVQNFTYREDVPYFQLMVPTVDMCRYTVLLEALLKVDKAVLFTGVTGIGKTAIVVDAMAKSASARKIVPVFVNFSAQTTSLATQEIIESKLEKKRKTRSGAPPGKKVVCFVDDVNMPAKEVFGAQPPVELLRQWLDFRGFYDRKKLFWKEIEDTTMVAACAPPGGGRQELTPRFLRHFSMFCLPPPSDTVMRHIFTSIVGGYLSAFSREYQSLCKTMVDATVEVFTRIQSELLPTPSKLHYTFNLRDVSRVFQGVLMMMPSNCADKRTMVMLWTHENMRVFHDRLINAEDKRYFTDMLYELLQRSMNISDPYDAIFDERPIMFGDYMRMGAIGDDRQYEEVRDQKKLQRLLRDYLDEYNSEHAGAMKLVFFLDAIEHISRLARILRQPRGNALLVGVGGSGKQSLTRFASFMSEYQCFQIELTRHYGMNEFHEDLKKLYKIAGVQGLPVTFLFTDTQIVLEGFVEDINNLLNTGEVPGLFAADERERILGEVRPCLANKGLPETRESIYAFFIDRVRENLHVVLAMSPVGEAFRTRTRQFPSIINCCTIDWYNDWPKEALHSVSTNFLRDIELGSAQIKSNTAKTCVEMHLTVAATAERFFQELRRRFYITPKSYLDLIDLYVHLLADKRAELSASRDRLLNGLQKLRETNAMVDAMRLELNNLQPVLVRVTTDTRIYASLDRCVLGNPKSYQGPIDIGIRICVR
jgi:dynein heavy chain